jgi:hypothetical protein
MKKLLGILVGALLCLAWPIAAQSDSPTALVPIPSTALETSHVFCTSACSLYGFSVQIGATSGWVYLLNTTSDPGNGTVAPMITPYPVTSNGTSGFLAVSFGNSPMRATAGLTIVFSTTCCFTETQSATAFFGAQKL